MKRLIICLLICFLTISTAACSSQEAQPTIVATTMPVYTFAHALCEGTPLQVERLVQENISCLHDYTLTVQHMQLLENARLLVISGAGLEDFLLPIQPEGIPVIDASRGITLHCGEDAHDHDGDHHHDTDPHYWLSIENARQMASTIREGLTQEFPQYKTQFEKNMLSLESAFLQLQNYADTQLSALSRRQIITFHDGFAYMADAFELNILKAIEEESGSEASAKELIEICALVTDHNLQAVFTEKNGSSAAASVISRETGTKLYTLDMAISGNDYFEAMCNNIDTLKEALG